MATDAPPDDLPKNELDFVKQWLEAIDISEREEKDWIDTAVRACDTYRGGPPKSSSSQTIATNLNTFNLFHSNIETLVPALYNSTPVPDVRRRFNDDDPIGKEVSEILERSLTFSLDAYDFDDTMLSAVRDMAITSRGIARVRYNPTVQEDDKGEPQDVTYEEVNCEYVPWKSFRRGPGKTWRDVPWLAFEQYLSYSEVEKLLDGVKGGAAILKAMKFSYTAEPKGSPDQQGENLSNLASRARVWEVWDRDNREVHFISPDYTQARITSVDDPLDLMDFYPIPRPLAAIMAPDSLVPITLLQIYETLLEELNIVQRRILRLTAQLRPRGGYAGLSADIKGITDADDGELVALSSAEMFATTGGGIDKAITWFPLEATTAALQQLVLQRDQIKATIYEVTGLSDIIRGASDPNETATAQQIKTQWGSLRIQRMQVEVARFARDIFRLKAEIMANKFSFQTFTLMTGLSYPTEEQKAQAQQTLQMGQQALQGQPVPPQLQEQAKTLQATIAKPSQEQVEGMLRNDALRGFRVDIESDSTIRGDARRNQEQMGLFLQGTAQYLSAVGPMVQEGAMPADVAIEIFSAFARSFRLGKQAEDALDRMADEAKNQAQQPKPPSPEEVKAKAEIDKMQLDAKIKSDQAAADMQMKQQEAAMRQQENDAEFAHKTRMFDLETRSAEMKLAIEARSAEIQSAQTERDAVLNSATAEHKHALGIETMDYKARMARQQPRPDAG